MLFDFRVFLGESFDGRRQPAGELLKSMDELEIEMALACPYKPLTYDPDEANASLARAIRGYPDRLFGAARVDPWQKNARETAERAFQSLALQALFLNPWEENFQADMQDLDPILDVAHIHGAPVIVASGFPWVSEALQVCRLAQRWPETHILMTNGGQINISGLGQADVTLAMGRTSNLLIDTAGVYRQDFIEETVAMFGPERVLFASGAPDFDQRFEASRIRAAKVDQDARLAMQSGNAFRLLKKTVQVDSRN